jgi:molybdate transport system ATP-binding protein
MLLDEPFAQLDVATRRATRGELRTFLRRARDERPRVVLLVTHDIVDALALGDHLAVLEGGRLSCFGRRDQALHQPRTPFLAELGGLNLLRGAFEAREPAGATRSVRVGSLLLHVPAGDSASGEVFLSFGPQEVTLERQDAVPHATSARNRFAGRVVELIPLVDRVRVRVDVGVKLVADVTADAAQQLALGPGAPVVATVKATAIEVYA